MPEFSLDEYQVVLSDLAEEIRRYGHSRQAFDLATKSLDTVVEAGRELHDAQMSTENLLNRATESVQRNAEQSKNFGDQTRDALANLAHVSESIRDQLLVLDGRAREYDKRVEDLLQALNITTESADVWRSEKDDQILKLMDQREMLESRISAEGQKGLIIGYSSLGLVVVVLVLQVVAFLG